MTGRERPQGTVPDTGASEARGLFARWTTRELVVGAVLAVAVGVLFWVWDLLYSGVFSALPFPLTYAVNGLWMVGGLLVPYVIRRPGASLLGETVAAFVSMMLVNQWGATTLLSGLVQGAGSEAVFAASGWRRYSLPVLLLAAVGAQVPSYFMDSVIWGYWNAYSTKAILAGLAIAVASALVLGGLLSKVIGDALARTGVLAGLAISRDRPPGRI